MTLPSRRVSCQAGLPGLCASFLKRPSSVRHWTLEVERCRFTSLPTPVAPTLVVVGLPSFPYGLRSRTSLLPTLPTPTLGYCSVKVYRAVLLPSPLNL